MEIPDPSPESVTRMSCFLLQQFCLCPIENTIDNLIRSYYRYLRLILLFSERMKCMVLFCKNAGKIPGITYFSLTPKRHDAWMRALGRNPTIENLSKSNRVCSEHFLDEDKYMEKNVWKLKQGAVPMLKLTIRPLVPIQDKIMREIGSISLDLPSTSKEIARDTMEEHYFDTNQEGLDYENKENSKTVISSPTIEIFQEEGSSSSSTVTPDSSVSFVKVLPRILHLKRKAGNNSSSSDSEGNKGDVKRARRHVKLIHNYSSSPRQLLTKLGKSECHKRATYKKLRVCQRRVQRLSKKVSSLKQVLWQLKKKNFLSDDAISVLEKSYSGIPLTLMRRAISNIAKNRKGKKQGREKIPEEIRSFALTLQFYSSKAYNYVRNTFNLALPAPSTIRSWLSNVDCNPGFCESSFISLAMIVADNEKDNKRTICSLMLDEMAIKKQIELRGNRTWGYEDFGAGITNDTLHCATEALVLMVVSVNSNWKIPIAYFLIRSLSGAEKANIVLEAIKKLHETGVAIISVTCDGPSAHFTMAQKLGANINMTTLQPHFKHPMTNANIFIIFDACHMLKLVRNNWANCQMFVDGDGGQIEFNFITKLYRIEEDEFCRLGTKLRRAHLEWQKQKMKVNLAAQTLSASVADALEFLMIDVQHADFQNAQATIRFIRIIDRVFDLLNSRNPFGRGYKTPLKPSNENFWRPILEEALTYLKALKMLTGELIWKTRNKTPVIGLSITITSMLGIYQEYVRGNESPLKYILGYKFSQDHLELFFCCLRGKNGWNNNPTAYQFYYTFKRLALRHDIKNLKGNCVVLDNTNILTTTYQNRHKTYPEISLDDMSIIKKYNIDVNEMIIDDQDFQEIISFLPVLSALTENVVTHISGFVVKSVKKITKCSTCLIEIEDVDGSSVDGEHFKLLSRKNRGGLIKPSRSVVNICSMVEKKIRQVLNITGNCMPEEKNFLETFIQNLSLIFFQNLNIFETLLDHVFDMSPYEDNHRMKLIKMIIRIYSKIRLYNIAKKQTESIRGEMKRKQLSKLILFHHQ